MSTKRTDKDARRERIAEIQAQQRRAEKRRTAIILGIAAAVALALVVPTVVVLTNEQRRQADERGRLEALQEQADQPIEGVVETEGITAVHVTTPVEYEQTPPVGGDHHPTWQNCGFYDEPVVEVHGVHSLEHGAVWITYDPDLPQADVDKLRDLTRQYTYLLVSPYEGLPSPVVASAWGLQLEVDSVDDERLILFALKYQQGEQTPEPGAPCTGGVGA